MIFDAEAREDAWFRDKVFDVCVVGTGPAGITVARALAKHGRRVGLFEGGGRERSAESQDLFAGEIVGEDYRPLDMMRLRFFGGTSNHWNGLCRELDAIDFAPRAPNPHSGWPITKADLDVYAEETAEILDLKPVRPSADPVLREDSAFEWITFRFSPPTRFKTKYEKELAESERISLYLNANLVGIGVDESRRSVTELRFRSYERDDEFAVKANCFVLCLGGLENPRALLNAQGADTYAIGNEYGLVGRYFSEHFHYRIGRVLHGKELAGRKFLGAKAAFIDDAEILNFHVRLRPPRPPKSYSDAIGCSTATMRQLAAAIGAPWECPTSRVGIVTEQALNPNSRVKLADTVDRFGLRRVALDWRLSEVDLRTITTGALEAGRFLAKHDHGRAKLWPWVLQNPPDRPSLDEDWVIGPHPMCTTRMSADRTQGVVDANCCVHGIENLYLGGSSVFATAGHANPTYTIVQLALRLGDHLNRRLG